MESSNPYKKPGLLAVMDSVISQQRELPMDWNSSGVTTAIMSALRQSINPHAKELGLFVCGGKGKTSLKTPRELMRVGEITGLDGELLTKCSKLISKVDKR